MKRLFGALALAVAASFGTSSEAQAQFTFGPGLAYHEDADLGIGVWASLPTPSIHEQISAWGSFIYFFPGGEDIPGGGSFDVNYWELNGGLSYAFPMEGSAITPYALAGLNIARASADYDGPFDEFIDEGYGDTEIGLNLGGGIRTMLGDSMTGVVGARIELGGGDGFVIEAGVGFPMGN